MPKERKKDGDDRHCGPQQSYKSKTGKRHKERKSESRGKSKERSQFKRRHKSSHRSSSSSSLEVSTSAASLCKDTDTTSLMKVLEDRRLQQRIERKRLKEEMKAKEKPEEKRARRLREKQEKEIRRRQRMGWDTEYQHYTNQDNPFGDSNLMSTFVWSKKLEKEGLKDISMETVEAMSRQKQLENKLELEKVKKRRQERELERQAREEEVTIQQRQREAEQFEEWKRQEDQFHLEQARLRSVIRIQDGRAKPIDLLAQYISSTKLEDAIEMQMHEPYFLLNGLGIKDLEDLLVDIKVYVELEKDNNSDFWDDMTVIVEDELKKLFKFQAEGEDDVIVGARREGINQSVAKDIAEIFRGKNTNQLEELRRRIEHKISSRAEGVDISYWESLLSQLKAHMARARLRDRHQESLRQKLKMLKSSEEELPSTSSLNDNDNNTANNLNGNSDTELIDLENDDPLEFAFRQYDEGAYSPQYTSLPEFENSIQFLSQGEDEDRIEQARAQFIEKIQEEKYMTNEELQMRCEARKGMLTDEAEFSVETPLNIPLQMSSDKYRPRKPRYFNRVHTGFEWNKYNQTHYDMDNPPPKIVQGYKFNIFYPDLINKASTPQYFLTPCEDNCDFAVLRFHAGPPYEDIAFKIVNREWEFSYKRGFRCQFQNNIFQLWFHFKRYRYRR